MPDQHAAFGIGKALNGREGGRADRWRDFGSLVERVRGVELSARDGGGNGAGNMNGSGSAMMGSQGRSAAARAREGR